MSTCHKILTTCQVFMSTCQVFMFWIFFWQFDILIWQVDINNWQVNIKIWQVDIIIGQVMAEISHRRKTNNYYQNFIMPPFRDRSRMPSLYHDVNDRFQNPGANVNQILQCLSLKKWARYSWYWPRIVI